jgi:lipopolysaccharide exporter
MIDQSPIRAAGNAMVWKFIQMGGVKVIYMVRLLVLAILLKPADFGLVAIATTATGFLLNLTNFGLIPALVQTDSADETRYDAVWIFEVARSILVAGLTIIFAPLIAQLFAEPRAVLIIQALALRPLIESMTSIKVVALNRSLSFRPLAYLKVVEALFSAILSITFAKTLGVWAMVLGVLGGTTSMVVTSYILVPHRPGLRFNWKAVQPLMKFGWWLLATSLIAMASNYGLRIVISRQLGAEGLGLYFLAVQLAFLPNEVASEAVGAIAFPLFARLQNEVLQATRVFRALFSVLAAVLYPVCALIIVLAPSLIHDVLGPNWTGTEAVVRVLAIVVIIGIFGEVAVSVFKGFGQPYRVTLLEVIQSTTTVAFMWALTKQFGLVGSALAWLPAILLSQLLSAIILTKILDHPFQGLQRPFLAIMFSTSVCVFVALASASMVPGINGSILAAILGMASTVAFLWVADRRYNLGFIQNFVMVFPQLGALMGVSTMKNKKSDIHLWNEP